jgi:hypothetical protein
MRPSVAPVCTSIATGTPSRRTHTRGEPFRAPLPDFLGWRGGRGIKAPAMPRPDDFSAVPGAGGVNLSAAFGTSKALSRVSVVISAVPVMPGRRLRSSFSTSSTVR